MTQPTLADSNFLLPNYTIFVEVVVFLVIMGVLGRFVVPRLQQTLRERQAMLQRQTEDTEQARSLLAKAENEYQEALSGARGEAAQIREGARAEAQHTLDELRTNAQQESERLVARGEQQLSAQRSTIMRELRAEIGTLAIELSEKIVGQSRLGDDADVTATVDSFLAGLSAQDHARSGTDS